LDENEERSRTTVLAKIAELVKTCPHFGDWDWCNVNCDLYDFCDGVYTVMDAEKVKKESRIP